MTLINFNQFETQYSLPLIITLSISCIIFHYIVRPYSGAEAPEYGVSSRWLTPEQTEQLFNQLGLEFLTQSGSFFTIIFLYLCHMNNLTGALGLNLSTLDPEVLTFILGRLKFLIANHELIFRVISNLVSMDEYLDLDFDYDPEWLAEEIHTAGNALIRLYREIELELNLDVSDLPLHWTED